MKKRLTTTLRTTLLATTLVCAFAATACKSKRNDSNAVDPPPEPVATAPAPGTVAAPAPGAATDPAPGSAPAAGATSAARTPMPSGTGPTANGTATNGTATNGTATPNDTAPTVVATNVPATCKGLMTRITDCASDAGFIDAMFGYVCEDPGCTKTTPRAAVHRDTMVDELKGQIATWKHAKQAKAECDVWKEEGGWTAENYAEWTKLDCTALGRKIGGPLPMPVDD